MCPRSNDGDELMNIEEMNHKKWGNGEAKKSFRFLFVYAKNALLFSERAYDSQ